MYIAWKVSIFGDFLVRIFPHLDWIRRDASYLSVFSPNAGKYGPELLRIQTLFTQWYSQQNYEKKLRELEIGYMLEILILIFFYVPDYYKTGDYKYDIFTEKNSKFLFYRFNDFLGRWKA